MLVVFGMVDQSHVLIVDWNGCIWLIAINLAIFRLIAFRLQFSVIPFGLIYLRGILGS
jgi:hypothetical protein